MRKAVARDRKAGSCSRAQRRASQSVGQLTPASRDMRSHTAAGSSAPSRSKYGCKTSARSVIKRHALLAIDVCAKLPKAIAYPVSSS